MNKPTDRTIFQNAWVVDDVEAACMKWVNEMGVGPFFITEYTNQFSDVFYRGQPGELSMIVALAQAGPTQVELIQPTVDRCAYRDSVAPGSVGFHHMCVWTHDIEADTAYFAGLGYDAANMGRAGDTRLTEKFYLFDVGVTNYLARRQPRLGSMEFGKSFEQYMLMELRAYQAYQNPDLPLYYWRTSTGQEVDFVAGEKDLAIEIKGSQRVHEGDIRSLEALREDGPVKRPILVCLEKERRKIQKGIEIIPWDDFIRSLWEGEFF